MTNGIRTIAHHRPLAASYGDGFAATMTNRQVEIGFGSRRLHFTMRSSRFHRSAAPSRGAGSAHGGSMLWRTMSYVGCASLVLGLVFVSGSILRAAPPVLGYAVVMPIDARIAATAPSHKAKPRRAVRARPVTPFTPQTDAGDDWSLAPATDADEADLGVARPNPDIATLPTVNGERAVAVYGPSRRVGGKSCRDVSVFVRDTDGKVSVSPATQCEATR